MRDAVQAILQFNSGFDPKSLTLKLAAITESPFAFFRATFHLFASDMMAGPFHKLPIAPSKGRVVADLHTENFGGFRGVTNELVYDINDFDDTAANQPYEFDLRRLLTSIVLGGVQSGVRLGDTLNAAETAARQYCAALGKFSVAKRRDDLGALHDAGPVRRLLRVAAEKPRAAFMKSLCEAGPKGLYEFKPGHRGFRPVDGKVRLEAEKRLRFYLDHCTAPKGTKVARFVFQDVVFRYAGKGSLGKNRYALLVSKQPEADYDSLRIIEWKDSTDSPLDRNGNKRKQSKGRNREVNDATLAFQIVPKRYLGYLSMFNKPFQAREIGANDCRFNHSQYADPQKLEQAAGIFGGIAARAHLLASLGTEGPRKFVARSGVVEDRLVHRLVAFAAAYSSRVHEDFDEVKKRRGELAKAWRTI